MNLIRLLPAWALNPTPLLHNMNDVHHYEKKLKWELNRLKETTFSRQDRVLIAKYAEFLEARGLNEGRIAKAIYQLRTLRIELK
ncbi:MAG: hypothetical protein ACRECH_18735, partial [Nitrososphaerales archaeon]